MKSYLPNKFYKDFIEYDGNDNYNQLSSHQEKSQLSILYGVSGVGKSVLVHKYCLDQAKNNKVRPHWIDILNLDKNQIIPDLYQLVSSSFPIQDISHYQSNHIEFLQHFYKTLQSTVLKDDQKFLLVLDGIDDIEFIKTYFIDITNLLKTPIKIIVILDSSTTVDKNIQSKFENYLLKIKPITIIPSLQQKQEGQIIKEGEKTEQQPFKFKNGMIKFGTVEQQIPPLHVIPGIIEQLENIPGLLDEIQKSVQSPSTSTLSMRYLYEKIMESLSQGAQKTLEILSFLRLKRIHSQILEFPIEVLNELEEKSLIYKGGKDSNNNGAEQSIIHLNFGISKFIIKNNMNNTNNSSNINLGSINSSVYQESKKDLIERLESYCTLMSIQGDNKTCLYYKLKSVELKQEVQNGKHDGLSKDYYQISKLYQKGNNFQKSNEFWELARLNNSPEIVSQLKLALLRGRNYRITGEMKSAFDILDLQYLTSSQSDTFKYSKLLLESAHAMQGYAMNHQYHMTYSIARYKEAVQKFRDPKFKEIPGIEDKLAEALQGRAYYIPLPEESQGLTKDSHFFDNLEPLKECLEIRFKRLLTDSHPILASIYKKMGDCTTSLFLYYDLFHFTAALDYYQKALTILQKSPAFNATSIAVIQGNIGKIYLKKGDVTLAAEYFDRYLATLNNYDYIKWDKGLRADNAYHMALVFDKLKRPGFLSFYNEAYLLYKELAQSQVELYKRSFIRSIKSLITYHYELQVRDNLTLMNYLEELKLKYQEYNMTKELNDENIEKNIKSLQKVMEGKKEDKKAVQTLKKSKSKSNIKSTEKEKCLIQ